MKYCDLTSGEERFRLLLRRTHEALLKPMGFRKDGQNFRLIRNDGRLSRGYIVHFQKSAFNDRTELRFTVNIGKKSCFGTIDPKFKDYDCFPDGQERLARIAPQYGFDKWWSITAETDMEKLETEILALLRAVGLPWLGLQR